MEARFAKVGELVYKSLPRSGTPPGYSTSDPQITPPPRLSDETHYFEGGSISGSCPVLTSGRVGVLRVGRPIVDTRDPAPPCRLSLI